MSNFFVRPHPSESTSPTFSFPTFTFITFFPNLRYLLIYLWISSWGRVGSLFPLIPPFSPPSLHELLSLDLSFHHLFVCLSISAESHSPRYVIRTSFWRERMTPCLLACHPDLAYSFQTILWFSLALFGSLCRLASFLLLLLSVQRPSAVSLTTTSM